MSIVNSNNFLHKTVDGVKQFFSPLVNAATVVRKDGTRLEQDGVVSADKLQGKSWSEMMLEIYPVGSIFMSVNETSPASLFGGTWEQLKDRFLLGAGDSYVAGSTGGEETVTLTIDEMPKHDHNVTKGKENDTLYISAKAQNNFGDANNATGAGNWQWNRGVPEQGGGQPHNNMPPYVAVYMWKRVS